MFLFWFSCKACWLFFFLFLFFVVVVAVCFFLGLKMYVYLLYINNKLKSQLDGMMQNSFIQRYISFLVAICCILCHNKLTLCHINE